MRKFIPNQVLDKLETENISVMYTVPTMLESLYKENRLIENKMKIISSGRNGKLKRKKNKEYISLCENI